MSIVTTNRYSLTLTGVDATDLDVSEIYDLWQQALGPVLNEQRQDTLVPLIDAGYTVKSKNSRVFTQSAQTFVLSREWTDSGEQAANDRISQFESTWPSLLPQDGPLTFEQGLQDCTIRFTHTDCTLQTDTSLSRIGFYTDP